MGLAAIVVCALFISAMQICADTGRRKSGSIYYQVEYHDGRMQDVREIPSEHFCIKSIKSIKSVTRIVSVVSAGQRADTYSTEAAQPFKRAGGHQIIRTKLKWNKKAWVGDPGKRAEELSDTDNLDTLSTEILGAAHTRPQSDLLELRNRLAFWELAAIELEADAFRFAGSEEAGDAVWDIVAVRGIQNRLRHDIKIREAELREKTGKEDVSGSVTKDKAAGTMKPVGKVTVPKADPSWRQALGIVQPTEKIGMLPHRVQVWKTPESISTRTINITMAHPEAGTFGSFYYVAYADTTGDGKPDTMIGRSPLAQATKPGGWTSWRFKTQLPRVYVGNCWPHANTSVYYETFTKTNWRKMDSRVYTSAAFGHIPDTITTGYLSNFRVRIMEVPQVLPVPAEPAKPGTPAATSSPTSPTEPEGIRKLPTQKR